MLLKKVQIDFAKLDNVVESLVGVVRKKVSIDDEKAFKIRLVSKELLTNVLSYSNADNILFSAALDNDELLTITIEDNGTGFASGDVMKRDVTTDEYLMKENGRGVFLVRMISDDLCFNEKGDTVMVKLKLNK